MVAVVTLLGLGKYSGVTLDPMVLGALFVCLIPTTIGGLLSAVGIAVSVVGARAARHVSVKHNLPHLEQTIIVLVANVLSFAIFWVLKLLLFNRLFHVHELEEFDEHLTVEEHEAPTA